MLRIICEAAGHCLWMVWRKEKSRFAFAHPLWRSGCSRFKKKKKGFQTKRSTCKEGLGNNKRWKHAGRWELLFLERSIFQMTAVGGSSAADKAQAILKTQASIREWAGCTGWYNTYESWDEAEGPVCCRRVNARKRLIFPIHDVSFLFIVLLLKLNLTTHNLLSHLLSHLLPTCCHSDTLSAFQVQIKCQIFSCFRESQENMYLRLPSLATIRAAESVSVDCNLLKCAHTWTWVTAIKKRLGI